MTTPTHEAFEKAVADFHRADTIEKQAGDLREAARATILDYWRMNMDTFTPVGEGKTMQRRINEEPKSPGVAITVPVKKGQPSRFDDTKTDEAFDALEDIDPVSANALFPTFRRFAGPEKVVEWGRECADAGRPDIARAIAGVLMKFALPATADEPQSPRVSPLK